MTTTTFDTLLYSKKLREVGCPELQAEIQAEALKEIVDNNIATKQDINALRGDMEKLEYRLTAKLGTMIVIAVSVLAALIKL